MKVWVNIHVTNDVMNWKAQGGRILEFFNNTGKCGQYFSGVYIGYKRMGRKHILALSRHRTSTREIQKTVGIWISESDYEVVSTGEMWTGKTKKGRNVIGRFGIYNVGTIIKHNGTNWILNSESGWEVYK